MGLILDSEWFLDPDQEIRIHHNWLPLWDQQGKLQFVTFRCKDSIPVKERAFLKSVKDYYDQTYPQPWEEEITRSFRQIVSEKVEELLDNGYGRCLLRYPELRFEVENSLRYFNGSRYVIIGFVIMPNHVHVLMAMLGTYEIEDTLKSIKKYSATQINKKIGEKGKFWSGINYCRLIRGQQHYESTRVYIGTNPKNLKEDEYTLYLL